MTCVIVAQALIVMLKHYIMQPWCIPLYQCFIKFQLVFHPSDSWITFALLQPQFGGFCLLLLSLLLERLADFLVGEPVHLLAGLVTVDHLVVAKKNVFIYALFKHHKHRGRSTSTCGETKTLWWSYENNSSQRSKNDKLRQWRKITVSWVKRQNIYISSILCSFL